MHTSERERGGGGNQIHQRNGKLAVKILLPLTDHQSEWAGLEPVSSIVAAAPLVWPATRSLRLDYTTRSPFGASRAKFRAMKMWAKITCCRAVYGANKRFVISFIKYCNYVFKKKLFKFIPLARK